MKFSVLWDTFPHHLMLTLSFPITLSHFQSIILFSNTSYFLCVFSNYLVKIKDLAYLVPSCISSTWNISWMIVASHKWVEWNKCQLDSYGNRLYFKSLSILIWLIQPYIIYFLTTSLVFSFYPSFIPQDLYSWTSFSYLSIPFSFLSRLLYILFLLLGKLIELFYFLLLLSFWCQFKQYYCLITISGVKRQINYVLSDFLLNILTYKVEITVTFS